MSTFAERAATIARLEAENAAAAAKFRHTLEAHARLQRRLAAAVDVYVHTLTVQWQALAADLRASRYARASSARRPPSR